DPGADRDQQPRQHRSEHKGHHRCSPGRSLVTSTIPRGRRADRAPGRWGACWQQGPHRPLFVLDQREEMVPSKNPKVVPSAVSNRRSTTKDPVAPANRPVPPVIVAVSSMKRKLIPGMKVPCPVNRAVSSSPLAATNL